MNFDVHSESVICDVDKMLTHRTLILFFVLYK